MRQIRITSTDTQGIFENNFNDDIILNPDSQIALKTLSMTANITEIEINSSNDGIDFQYSTAGGTKTAILTHGDYGSITYPQLFHDMNIQMCKQLTTTGTNDNKAIGMEIKNKVNTEGKFVSEFKQSALNEATNLQVLDKGTYTVTRSGAGVYTGHSATIATNEAFFYIPEYISKGGGVVRMKINNASNTHDNFIIGLSKTNPDTLTVTDFPNANLHYAIHCDTTANPYNTVIAGVYTATATSPNFVGVGDNNNDSLELTISGGKVEGRIYNNTTGTTVLFSENYNFNDKLYPVVILRGASSDSSVRLYRNTLSPYNATTTDKIDFHDDYVSGLTSSPPQQFQRQTNFYLEFEGQSLANFLGFTYPRYPTSGVELTREFFAVSQENFRASNISDAFIVELLNIPVKSYDGGTSQRRNILSVIPVSDKDSYVLYDAHYPVFLNLNLSRETSLRNIRLRVLNNDLSPLITEGLSTITLLIKEKDER